MFCTQVDILPVPVAVDTILYISEGLTPLYRLLSFRNLTDSVLSFEVDESSDGSTWTNLIAAFTVSGGAIVAKATSSIKLLRIRGYGGSSDDDVEICYSRPFSTTNGLTPATTWNVPRA